MAVNFRIADLVAVSLVAAVVATWAAFAGRAFSLLALLACEAVFFTFYLVGSLCAGWRPLAAGVLFDLPLRLLMGYAAVNTALFGLAWLSPLGIVTNFALLFALVAGSFVATRPRQESQGAPASYWLIVICLAAATLWCQDSIRPTSQLGNTLVVKPWVDSFYHAVHIRIFAASHGASSIEDFRLVGMPARPYHYGVYLTPALIKQASGIESYTAFTGILAPTAVFFSGLAAYAFIGSLWGAWPGLAAAVALLLLPDGAQQGIPNTFMSYHWLTQISPSATYGLALLAVAWLFVIQGCMRGSRLQLLVGWLVSGILIFYKLHFVVASALLLLLLPPLFFHGKLGFRRRALWAVTASAVGVAALVYGQKVPGVPVIRFDGSSAGEVLRLVQSFGMPGRLHDYFANHMGAEFSRTSNLLFGVPYVLSAILGFFLPALVILALRSRRQMPLLPLLFPFLLIANFLAMFFGLALDFDSSTPDELSHRPLLVVYFFVVAWVGGALGVALCEPRRLGRLAPPVILGLAILLMAVPASLGAGVQRMWAMPGISPVRAPIDLVRLAEYMRDNGSAEDIFQDSQFDRTYLVAALSERRAFVAHTMTRMNYRSDIVQARTNTIDSFMSIRQPKTVLAKARTLNLRWFLLEPGDRVDWPAEIAEHPAFQAGQFKLYRF